MKIKDLGRDYADLLEAVGVESVSELRRRNPESLHESMQKINIKAKIPRFPRDHGECRGLRGPSIILLEPHNQRLTTIYQLLD